MAGIRQCIDDESDLLFPRIPSFSYSCRPLAVPSGGYPLARLVQCGFYREEPYSIVMTASETLGNHAGNFKLWASDIDSKVLATAARGVYRLENIKGLDQTLLRRFFMRGKGGNDGMVRVKPELQGMIEFLIVNLIRDDWPFREPFDVVFCRNVMIYFDGPTQRRVLEKIHRVMKPGGLLFAGHSENFNDSRDLFVLRGKTVYERC